jgi:ribosomal protein S18 acetylase RimI-like enzyme
MIRPANLDDAGQILSIEKQCFTSDRLSIRSIRYFLRNPKSRLFIYVQDNLPIGYVLTLHHPRSRFARHYSIAVLPEYRGRGVAEALLLRAEQACAEKHGYKLEIRKDNTAARRLYTRMGYKERGLKKHYYQDGQDAIEMVKATWPS